MTDLSPSAAARLASLRQDFDQVFASPAGAEAGEMESLIALRLEGDAYGFSVAEISQMTVAGKLVAIPSRSPGLLGVAGIRGAVIPVYSLAVLLGYPKAEASVRWLALAGGKEPLALGLGDYEGYLRVPKAALVVPDRDAQKHVQSFVRANGAVRTIVSIASIVSSIQGSSSPGP
jgi:chemotaxis signal transduction protein